MKTYIDEIIQEWTARLPELLESKQKITQENTILKQLRGGYVFIKKYFIFKNNTKSKIEISNKQKNLIKVKSSSLNALNIAKERELMKLKKAYKNLIQLEKEELVDPFKQDDTKQLEDRKVCELKVEEREVYDTKAYTREVCEPKAENREVLDTKVGNREVHVDNINKQDNVAKDSKSEVKNKMKSLLNAFRSKSQKTADQNKENIPDHSVMIEDGEVKLFIVNKKKRVQDYLKESKRRKNKQEDGKTEKEVKEQVSMLNEDGKEQVGKINEDVKMKDFECDTKENEPPKENKKDELFKPIKENKKDELLKTPKENKKDELLKTPKEKLLHKENKDVKESEHTKQPTQKPSSTIFDFKKRFPKHGSPEKVYDVGTNRFIPSSELQSTSSSQHSNLTQHSNLKYLCRTPLKDSLYKNIIDKERRSRSRIGMNEFIPKSSVPEVTSDDEGHNEAMPLSEKEISEALRKQNHEEIEKYFNSELTIDIELLFPNIKELSNDSPNKWA